MATPSVPGARCGRTHLHQLRVSEDADLAGQIRAGFEHAGVACWIAPRDIQPGTSFPAAITAAIHSCGALVLLLTPQSNTSRTVLSEVELAFNASKPILAVLIGAVAPSADLQSFISTPATGIVSPTRLPVHTVRLSRGFWLARPEVTNAQYEKRMKSTLQRRPPLRPERTLTRCVSGTAAARTRSGSRAS